jgi:hypothetical protein
MANKLHKEKKTTETQSCSTAPTHFWKILSPSSKAYCLLSLQTKPGAATDSQHRHLMPFHGPVWKALKQMLWSLSILLGKELMGHLLRGTSLFLFKLF